MLKSIQYTLGIVLIIRGIAGLFLPILQGLLPIGLGVLVLRGHRVKDV